MQKNLQKLNFADRSDFDEIAKTVKNFWENQMVHGSIRLFIVIMVHISR